jgi:uncharacterized pyridoxamine 5'-phosphate oxidase family protein
MSNKNKEILKEIIKESLINEDGKNTDNLIPKSYEEDIAMAFINGNKNYITGELKSVNNLEAVSMAFTIYGIIKELYGANSQEALSFESFCNFLS